MFQILRGAFIFRVNEELMLLNCLEPYSYKLRRSSGIFQRTRTLQEKRAGTRVHLALALFTGNRLYGYRHTGDYIGEVAARVKWLLDAEARQRSKHGAGA
jgi:hypothetical protein